MSRSTEMCHVNHGDLVSMAEVCLPCSKEYQIIIFAMLFNEMSRPDEKCHFQQTSIPQGERSITKSILLGIERNVQM